MKNILSWIWDSFIGTLAPDLIYRPENTLVSVYEGRRSGERVVRVSRKERENISAFPKAKAGVDCKKKKKEELDDDDDNEEERDIASIIFSTVHRVLHLNTLTHSFMVKKKVNEACVLFVLISWWYFLSFILSNFHYSRPASSFFKNWN